MAVEINYSKILEDRSSFQIARTNPKLTGNVKFTVDGNDNMWLNSIDANDELSKDDLRLINLPWSERLRNRSFLAIEGTYQTARQALKSGIACHVGGGTHHAHRDHGLGFCVFNDLGYTEKNLIAASEKDLFLYRQMGASYLCIASKAEVDFNKGLGIASATFANVIIGKHGGAIKELGNEKLDQKRLYNAGTFQIVGSALNICPESIPKNIKNDYEKRLRQLVKENKK